MPHKVMERKSETSWLSIREDNQVLSSMTEGWWTWRRKVSMGLPQTPSTVSGSAEKALERAMEGVWGETKQLLDFLTAGKWHHSLQQQGNAKVETYRYIFTW